MGKKDERRPRLLGGKPEAIPRCQRDACCVLWQHVAHVEHNGGKAAGLKKKVGRLERLLKTRYFERNVAVVQVLLDRAAIETGAVAKGETYKYIHLGHGYCANPYWAQCVHRMACQRCEFYVPGDSARAQALEADAHNLKLLEEIPVTETERKALEGDRKALKKLIANSRLTKLE